jgi:hypothetical protein
MQSTHFIQAVIALVAIYALPGALQLPGYWSGVAFLALGVSFSAWALYRANVHGRGPFW